MASRQWYAAIRGKQDGPFSDQRIRELIAGGTVTAETLVWCDGMTDWAKAGAVPGLVSASLNPPPLPAGAPPHGVADGALSTRVRTWPLLGRTLLLALCQIVVIPLPWAATSFFRWFVDNIELPGQRRVAFAGKTGDIWYVFILYALCSYVSVGGSQLDSLGAIGTFAPWLLIPVTTIFTLIIVRWFFANLVWEGQQARLRFTGGYWALLGWSLLASVSFITIIGWAWVYTAWARWLCRNVKGSARQLVFTGRGWSYLWRTLVFVLVAILIVPIPWILRWYTRWIVSQFALTQPV